MTVSTVPLLPTRVSRAVVSGMIAMLSWSWNPFDPFDLNTPTTVKDLPPSMTCCPTSAEPSACCAEQVLHVGEAEDDDVGVLVVLLLRDPGSPLRPV